MKLLLGFAALAGVLAASAWGIPATKKPGVYRITAHCGGNLGVLAHLRVLA